MFQSIVMIQNWDAQLVSRLLQGFMTGTNISRIRAPKIMTATFFCKHCNEECTGAEIGLADHLLKEHNLVGVFICLYCHTLYATERKLDRHHEHCSKKNPMKSEQPLGFIFRCRHNTGHCYFAAKKHKNKYCMAILGFSFSQLKSGFKRKCSLFLLFQPINIYLP